MGILTDSQEPKQKRGSERENSGWGRGRWEEQEGEFAELSETLAALRIKQHGQQP